MNFLQFYDNIHKLLNNSLENFKSAFFNLLDKNKDSLVCEKDLFDMFMLIKSHQAREVILEDLMTIFRYIEIYRTNHGKDDKNKLISLNL